MKRKSTGERSDKKALAAISAAGWDVSQAFGGPLGETRSAWVAQKIIHEKEDESTTRLFESAFTLEALAKRVRRREAEEAR
jgi:hypothetical protein